MRTVHLRCAQMTMVSGPPAAGAPAANLSHRFLPAPPGARDVKALNQYPKWHPHPPAKEPNGF